MKVKAPFVRSPFNYDVEEASNAACIPADKHGVSLTVQSMSEDADINVLMRRYGILGTMPQSVRIPEYGDYSGISDFRSALEAVEKASDNFNAMPADVRARFQNNPQVFLEFACNPDNIGALREMGLAKEISDGGRKAGVGGAGKAPGGDAGASGGVAAVDGAAAGGGKGVAG